MIWLESIMMMVHMNTVLMINRNSSWEESFWNSILGLVKREFFLTEPLVGNNLKRNVFKLSHWFRIILLLIKLQFNNQLNFDLYRRIGENFLSIFFSKKQFESNQTIEFWTRIQWNKYKKFEFFHFEIRS